jgi:Leucine-rich repeat (LRR) protein
MEKNDIYNLRLSWFAGWCDNDINFLSTMEFLKGVEIYGSTEIRDLTPLYSLSGLEFLGLDDYMKADLDFSKFGNLKICLIYWCSKYKHLFKVNTLKHLLINKYPYENFNELSNLKNLEILDVTSRKLQSLDGIQDLNKLKVLKLFRCTSLVDLTGIEHLTELKELDIDTCKKITNLNGAEKLKNLEIINLDNCKEIDSLRLLKNCTKLKSIFIGDSNIKDGDFSELLMLPYLIQFLFAERKHYTLNREEVSLFLKTKREISE